MWIMNPREMHLRTSGKRDNDESSKLLRCYRRTAWTRTCGRVQGARDTGLAYEQSRHGSLLRDRIFSRQFIAEGRRSLYQLRGTLAPDMPSGSEVTARLVIRKGLTAFIEPQA